MIKFLKRKLGLDDIINSISELDDRLSATSKRASNTMTINEANFGFENVQEDLSDLEEKLSERIAALETQMISEDGVRVFQKTFRDKTTGESVVQKIIEQRTKF